MPGTSQPLNGRLVAGLVVALIVLAAGRLALASSPVQQLLNGSLAPLNAAVDRLAFPAEQANSDQLAAIKQLQAENAELRRAAQLPRARYQVVAEADVVSRDLRSARRFLTVNIGSRRGLEVGDIVLDEGTLLGRVTKVSQTAATVQVVGDPELRFTAQTLDQKATGVVKTDYGSLMFDLVSAPDQGGKTISTNGLDGVVPSGLVVGTLDRRIQRPGTVFDQYTILLAARPYTTQVVQIIKG